MRSAVATLVVFVLLAACGSDAGDSRGSAADASTPDSTSVTEPDTGASSVTAGVLAAAAAYRVYEDNSFGGDVALP